VARITLKAGVRYLCRGQVYCIQQVLSNDVLSVTKESGHADTPAVTETVTYNEICTALARGELAFEVKGRHAARSSAPLRNASAAEPEFLLIVGPTGSGKTTLIKSYAQQFRSVDTGVGIHAPVLMTGILSPATIKSLAQRLLTTLGDPAADKGSVATQSLRLRAFFDDCGVELLILDELQHFVDRDSLRVLHDVSNWLKDLIKDTGVACVLVGLQGEAELVLKANTQLHGLFRPPAVLDPFAWDDASPDTIREFRTLLGKLDRLLPLRERSGLAERDLALRCFVASRGNMRLLMGVIRWATIFALQRGQERLDEDLLAEAFDERVEGFWPGVANPFRGPTPELPPPPTENDSTVRRTRRSGEQERVSAVLRRR
jgi:hypothetical protein